MDLTQNIANQKEEIGAALGKCYTFTLDVDSDLDSFNEMYNACEEVICNALNIAYLSIYRQNNPNGNQCTLSIESLSEILGKIAAQEYYNTFISLKESVIRRTGYHVKYEIHYYMDDLYTLTKSVVNQVFLVMENRMNTPVYIPTIHGERRYVLPGTFEPFKDAFQSINRNTYIGKSAYYLEGKLNPKSVSKRVPPKYVSSLIFPVNPGTLEGLRFDKNGILQPCKITESNAICVASELGAFDAEKVYSGEISKEMRKISLSLDINAWVVEEHMSKIARELGVGGTYTQMVDRLTTIAENEAKAVRDLCYSDLLPVYDCRNVILYYDGYKVYWFNNEWIWCSGTIDDAKDAGVFCVWKYLCVKNSTNSLYFKSGIGNKIAILQPTAVKYFGERYYLRDYTDRAALNLQVLSELNVGESVWDFYRKVPPTSKRKKINGATLYNTLLFSFDDLYGSDFLYNPTIEIGEKHDVVGISRVRITFNIQWIHRAYTRKWLEDNRDNLADYIFHSLELSWGDISGEILPVEFFKKHRLLYLDERTKLCLELQIPLEHIQRFENMGRALHNAQSEDFAVEDTPASEKKRVDKISLK